MVVVGNGGEVVEMVSDVVNNMLALVVGLVTGFYFERRSTKVAQRQALESEVIANELREDLRNTRLQLLGRHGSVDVVDTSVEPAAKQVVLAVIREFQDASGKTSVAIVRNQMTVRGLDASALGAILDLLVSSGEVTRAGNNLQVNS